MALDDVEADLSIYLKKTLYIVPVMKFVWNLWLHSSVLPHIHGLVCCLADSFKSTAIGLQGGIGWCPYVGVDIHVSCNRNSSILVQITCIVPKVNMQWQQKRTIGEEEYVCVAKKFKRRRNCT